MIAFLIALFLATLRISVPYVLAALGGTLSERAGVINLALEGMLLMGAFSATLGADLGGGPLSGAAFGMLGGLSVALVYALCVQTGRADQVVAGIALNLVVLGLTRYLLKVVYGSLSNSPRVPGFAGVWAVGFITFAGSLALLVHFLLERTAFGLRLRASGEHAAAAASLGVSVGGVRFRAILASGILAGLGGAWLALDQNGFTDQMSGGRGYIAIAAVIFGQWRPLGATLACLLFAFAEALQGRLQTEFAGLPHELLQSLPYLVTIVLLCGWVGRSRPPAELGFRED